jgi:hypothetical protein
MIQDIPPEVFELDALITVLAGAVSGSLTEGINILPRGELCDRCCRILDDDSAPDALQMPADFFKDK